MMDMVGVKLGRPLQQFVVILVPLLLFSTLPLSTGLDAHRLDDYDTVICEYSYIRPVWLRTEFHVVLRF
jgi:hypothetical protein